MSRFRALFSSANVRALLRGRMPGQVVLQYTDRCNASCAQCGMRVSSRFERTTMDKDRVKAMIDAAALKGVTALSFTGGEPLLYLEEIAELAAYARRAGIALVRTGTNGFIFRGSDKPDFGERMERTASLLAGSGLNTFWISLDSADPATHESNRGLKDVVEGMAKALPVFHAHGLYPAANLGINRLTGGPVPITGLNGTGAFSAKLMYERFRDAFRAFYNQALSLGFTMANACYPMSFEQGEGDPVYAATSTDSFIRFEGREKGPMFKALYDTIPEFRDRLRIFTPRSSLLTLMRESTGRGSGFEPYACRGGIDFFFVDSRDMRVYPCGYRGTEDMGRLEDLDLGAVDAKARCTRCDWECFRDPSELAGPLTDLATRPGYLIRRLANDRTWMRTWWEDVRYYRACAWFDARQAPDYTALERFVRLRQ